MATIECWQPYTPLDQLLSSTLVLTDGEGDVEHAKKELPRSTRRAIKFIRNQKLRPRPGFQRRETWMENQLRLSGDAVYLDLVKNNNHSTLRRESSQSKKSSTERRWINLDLLMDPTIKESSKRLVRTRPSQTVVYKRKNWDRTVCSFQEPLEPIPVYEQHITRSSRSPRHPNRIKRINDSDRSKSLEDIDRSETPRDDSRGNSTEVVSKPENYTEILHYVDETKSMGVIDTFEPIYVIKRKSKEQGPRRAWLPEEVVYTRQTTARRTYHTGDTTLNVEHRSTDNIVVQIDSARVNNEKGREDGQADSDDGRRGKERRQKAENEDTGDEEETKRKFKNNGKRITFSEETDKAFAKTDNEKADGPTRVRAPSKVAKACGHKLPMVRVGGGWMEVPDYLRFHVPMHVHTESTKDGHEGNLIIRSQRPRSQMFSKKGESPSWTATLSRGTKGSASTTMRQRLV